MTQPISKRLVLLTLIIVLAAFFRLYRINDYMEYLGDQGRDLIIIREFLVNKNLFFIGPQTSVGNMYLGPWFYYFIAPSLLFAGYNPVGPAIFTGLLGVLTIYLVYHVASRWFSVPVGLAASLLMSISPVVIKYSTSSWNPNVMPLFSLLFIYFLCQKRYIPATISFIMIINSHYLGILLLAPAIFILIHNYKTSQQKIPIFIRHLIFPAILFIISLSPLILFDLKHQGQNIGAVLRFFSQRETTVNLKPYKAFPLIFPLTRQVFERLLLGKNHLVSLVATLLFLLGSLMAFIRFRFSNYYLNLIYLWIFTGIVGLALYKQHIYDHYFGFIFPAIFILAAYLIVQVKYSTVRYIIIAVLVILSLVENPFRWPPPKQLQTSSQITDSIIADSQNLPFNFALLAKQNYDPPYRYLFILKGAPLYSIDQKLTKQLYVVCEPFQTDCNPINNPEWSVAAFGWGKIAKSWQINGISIYKIVHNI